MFEYELQTTTAGVSNLVFLEATPPSSPPPLLKNVTYNFQERHLAGYCTDSESSTSLTPCLKATFKPFPYLNLRIEDSLMGEVTNLRSEAQEWQFLDDAPSFSLLTLNSSGYITNDKIMETAVTKWNHCNLLKVCLNGNSSRLALLAALGVALEAQDKFGMYCKGAAKWTQLPRIFSVANVS